jgi:hypothetical protein
MTDQGLGCECRLPLKWSILDTAVTPTSALEREALLLLTVINQMEAVHELEAGSTEQRRLERVEAKLDLALYLLARTLEPGPAATEVDVKLSAEEIRWPETRPPASGTPLLLELRPSPTLPLSLRLPALAMAPEGGWARASLRGLAEPVADVLHQFIFRRHRQAIRARQGGTADGASPSRKFPR